MKVIEFDLSEGSSEEMLEKMFNELKEELDKIPKERLEIYREKKKLEKQLEEINDKLHEVTGNSYAEIGKFINEYLKNDLKAMTELYDKCKKWLDDNNMPYEED